MISIEMRMVSSPPVTRRSDPTMSVDYNTIVDQHLLDNVAYENVEPSYVLECLEGLPDSPWRKGLEDAWQQYVHLHSLFHSVSQDLIRFDEKGKLQPHPDIAANALYLVDTLIERMQLTEVEYTEVDADGEPADDDTAIENSCCDSGDTSVADLVAAGVPTAYCIPY